VEGAVALNGGEARRIDYPGQAGMPYGCAERVAEGMVARQWGNWTPSRAGWCPGPRASRPVRPHGGRCAHGSVRTLIALTAAFFVGGGWNVTAAMTSEYDNYLFLTKGEDVATNDDFDGLDARIDTDVEMAGMYTVYACAYADGRGAYTLTIATSAGN
jgi:hypothetical protein